MTMPLSPGVRFYSRPSSLDSRPVSRFSFQLFRFQILLSLHPVPETAGVLQPSRFGSKNNDHGLLRAVELALAGKWDAAHQLVQQYESDDMAAWIHAVLHKIEGDAANARYWYRRANRLDRADDEPRAELAAIQAELTAAERG
jgi:hypothetical protein